MSYTPEISGDTTQLAQQISSNIQKITQCCKQQKQQYTNQLAKETDKCIKEFGSLPTTPSEQRQKKIQKDCLVAEFTTSLTNFQKVQRQAVEREKEFVARVRASSRVSRKNRKTPCIIIFILVIGIVIICLIIWGLKGQS